MIDVADPEENYSVARYVEEASRCVDKIISRGKLPVVVGGTGLYIDSLISGRSFAQAPGDDFLRSKLNRQYDHLGGQAMLEKLAKVDPRRAEKLHPADKKRIVRALEVWHLTGKTITEHDDESPAAVRRGLHSPHTKPAAPVRQETAGGWWSRAVPRWRPC